MSDPLKLDFDQLTHPTNPPDPRADQTHGPTHQTNINTKRKQIQIQIFTVTDEKKTFSSQGTTRNTNGRFN